MMILSGPDAPHKKEEERTATNIEDGSLLRLRLVVGEYSVWMVSGIGIKNMMTT